MPGLDSLINKLPDEMQDTFQAIWNSLPTSDKNALQTLVKSFPSDANLIRLLVGMASRQFKVVVGKKHKVAIVGPANVGKSTLYNQLIHQKGDRADVSPVPGTTRLNQEADAGLFAIIDTPGADAVGYVGEGEKLEALSAASTADFLVIIFDAIQGIKQTELELFDELIGLGKPYIVVLNKMDLVKKESQKVLEKAAVNLRLKIDQIIPVIAKDGKSLNDVVMAIAVTDPEIIAALGQALPDFRWQLAWRSIVSAASISAVIALTPIPIIDFAPLVITQSVMVLSLARIYNYKINLARARELVATFGLGLLGRTLFSELSKFGGLPGWILSAAIAASVTVGMGYAAVVWFERGEKLSSGAMKKITRGFTGNLLNSLRKIGKKKPDQKTLQDAISQTLENMPISDNEQGFVQVISEPATATGTSGIVIDEG